MARDFDPYRLASPQVYLWRMIIFLIIAGTVALILYRQVYASFLANPALLHWFRSPQDWHEYDDDTDDIASARSCAADRDCVMHCTQQGRARYGRSIDGAC